MDSRRRPTSSNGLNRSKSLAYTSKANAPFDLNMIRRQTSSNGPSRSKSLVYPSKANAPFDLNMIQRQTGSNGPSRSKSLVYPSGANAPFDLNMIQSYSAANFHTRPARMPTSNSRGGLNEAFLAPSNRRRLRGQSAAALPLGLGKPLHRSSPSMRSSDSLRKMALATAKASPSISSTLNATFNLPVVRTPLVTRPSTPSTPKHSAMSAAEASRVRFDQIVQRSSSKSVKETLARLRDLCHKEECSQTSAVSAPWKDVQMLLKFASSDVYYRVVIKKGKGVETINQIRNAFPEMKSLCNDLLRVLDGSGTPSNLLLSPIPSPQANRSISLRDFPSSLIVMEDDSTASSSNLNASNLSTE